MRGDDLSQVISESAPSFCSVYVVGDGKLQQLRPADSEQNVISMEDTSNLSSTSTDSSSSSSSLTIGDFADNKMEHNLISIFRSCSLHLKLFKLQTVFKCSWTYEIN